MCGITGWVDFARDLTRERAVVDAMTATMACRGPDAEGVWLQPHAALGHRRLAVIDVAGGAQPMVAEHDGRAVAAITYSGETYNFRELRQELTAAGHSLRTRSDTEVVLHAYLEWGRSFVERLNGMYAFALWDPVRERLLLVRDRMGIKPLYYVPLPDGVLFGSEPKAILANPLHVGEVGTEGLFELLTMIKTPGRAVWHGMREVRPGTVVEVSRQGLAEATYWALEARPHEDGLETTIRTVRELLEDIVERQLISDVPLCTLLSGGLDSSALTALAADRLQRAGTGPVRSFAVDFAGYADGFQPDAFRDTADAPFVHELARHVESEHEDVVLDNARLLDREARTAVLRARDMPGMGDLDTSLYLLFRAIRERSTVALSGESADEVFGGYRWYHDPMAVGSGTFPWMAGFGGSLAPAFLRDDLVRELDVDGHLAASYRAALDEVPRLPGEDPAERRMREISHLAITRFLRLLLDRKDRMSMAVGLEVRVPFCDHRLVEYVFNAPWRLKTFDGREKSLLRAATADFLPRSIVERRKSPYPSTQDPAYDAGLRRELASVVADPAAPVLAIGDRGKLEELTRPAEGPRAMLARLAVEQVLALNAWLADYRPGLLL